MRREVVILIAEDDEGHATLIERNLKRAGIANDMLHFRNGQETLDFLFCRGDGNQRECNSSYLLLLDIRMPMVDGIEVLRQVKENPELCKIPVIMITTTDDPQEVDYCHKLGCNNYITKPIDYPKFVEAIRNLGLFLSVVEIPMVTGRDVS